MALERRIDTTRPDLAAPVGRQVRRHVLRETAVAGRFATGTLACPSCDAPVATPSRPLSPVDGMACGWCGHDARVRDFLSLAAPPRPTRVDVRVVQRRG